MSWCPKCKNEYRAGITVCPDCNEELMEELSDSIALEFVPVFQTADVTLKEKLVKYLAHCNHKVQETSVYAENEEVEQVETFAILVPKEDATEAMKEIRTALIYEAKQKDGEEDLKPRHREPEPSTLYVDAKSRYQEYKSSGIMFLAFASFFLVFGILNVAGVIRIMASVPSLVIVFGATIAFVYIGIISLKKTASLKEEASAEESSTEDILDYLKSEFPKEVLEKITKDTVNGGEELTGEELYFVRMAEMKNYVMSEYPEKDENYLDALLEDYYNSLDL